MPGCNGAKIPGTTHALYMHLGGSAALIIMMMTSYSVLPAPYA
jgi:hypothetical protein